MGISQESSVQSPSFSSWVLGFRIFTNLTTQPLNYLTFLLCVNLCLKKGVGGGVTKELFLDRVIPWHKWVDGGLENPDSKEAYHNKGDYYLGQGPAEDPEDCSSGSLCCVLYILPDYEFTCQCSKRWTNQYPPRRKE